MVFFNGCFYYLSHDISKNTIPGFELLQPFFKYPSKVKWASIDRTASLFFCGISFVAVISKNAEL